jgi:hypothetical protein
MDVKNIFQEQEKLIGAVKYLPAVSIILPFEPVMSLRTELEYKLKIAVQKVESSLMKDYAMDKALPVILRLKSLVSNVNFNTHKKSIAIFASPLIEKIIYLDIPVEEKIIIDESFEIRDLVYSKKELNKYLLLVLTGKSVKIYLGNTTQFIRIVSAVPDSIAEYENDIPERVSNFSDPSYRKEVMLDKFLHHVDIGLDILLKAYPLPLFVMATERTIGHFKKRSKNKQHVIDFIHGNFEEATEAELKKAIQPYIKDWKRVKQQNLLQILDVARGAKKLAFGIKEVWKAAQQKRGHLLVVEKNYMVPAQQGTDPEIIYQKDFSNNNSFYIKDAVDDIIEKLLENGGDVEFVDENLLAAYDHIALTLYY